MCYPWIVDMVTSEPETIIPEDLGIPYLLNCLLDALDTLSIDVCSTCALDLPCLITQKP